MWTEDETFHKLYNWKMQCDALTKFCEERKFQSKKTINGFKKVRESRLKAAEDLQKRWEGAMVQIKKGSLPEGFNELLSHMQSHNRECMATCPNLEDLLESLV